MAFLFQPSAQSVAALPSASQLSQIFSTSSLGVELAQSMGILPQSSEILNLIITAELLPRSELAPADRLTFSELAQSIRTAPASIRTLPIIFVGAFHTPGKHTGGILSHQYVVVGVQLSGGRRTYVRLEMFLAHTANNALAGPCVLACQTADDCAAITHNHPQTCALELAAGADPAGGPSLDALAELLALVEARVPARGYGALAHNCTWLTDLLVFVFARRFREHWLARGTLTPENTFQRYLRGELGVLDAAGEINFPKGGPLRWWARVGAGAVRGVQVLFTQGDGAGMLMHDDEVAEVERMWQGFMEAVAQA